MLKELAEGVWYEATPVRILGTRLTSTMTVLRLSERELMVVSPIPLTKARQAALAALGEVTHLYAPNAFHHLWLADFCRAYPGARVHGPAELARKRPDLRIDRFHDQAPEPAFEGVIDEVPIQGFRLGETALVYRPGRTAVVADLVHNVGRPDGLWTRLYTRMMGFYGRVALSRALCWLGFSDRRAARFSVDALLALPFDRLVVGHGAPIESDAHEVLAEAMGWLPSRGRPALGEAKTTISTRPCG